MKKVKCLLLSLFAIYMMVSCNETLELNPYKSTDSNAPMVPVVTNVKSIAGGAVIIYEVPEDYDLMYIKALFEDSHGKIRESRSSFYVDSLMIEGIGDVNEREVTMTAVDRSGNSSEDVIVNITPGKPAITKIYESIKEQADWGGFLLDYFNEDMAEVGIYVTYTNEITEETVLHDIFFTSKTAGTLAVRGLQNVSTDFSVFVVDKWDNSSDTLRFNLTPWKESELDKTNVRLVPSVLNDVAWNHYGGEPLRAWDNIMPGSWNFAHTAFPVSFPHGFSFDLGVSIKPSRFKIWQYLGGDSDYYAHGAPRHFLIYGAKEGSDPYQAESWELLMDATLDKPSGGGFTDPATPDDMEEAQRGHEFAFSMDVPKIRYFRFVSLASWSGMEVSRVAEFSLWGDIDE